MLKKELARLYMPEASAATANRNLNRWVEKNSVLSVKLYAIGYSVRTRRLTPAQTALFIEYLGEP